MITKIASCMAIAIARAGQYHAALVCSIEIVVPCVIDNWDNTTASYSYSYNN